jgi:hypothetical protein
MEYQSDDVGIIGEGKVQRITKKRYEGTGIYRFAQSGAEQSGAEQSLPLRAAFESSIEKMEGL